MHVVQNKKNGEMWIAEPAKLKMLHNLGARVQEWGPDTPALYDYTAEFNDVRNSIAISLRNSLLAHNETDAFSCSTSPWKLKFIFKQLLEFVFLSCMVSLAGYWLYRFPIIALFDFLWNRRKQKNNALERSFLNNLVELTSRILYVMSAFKCYKC